MKNKILKTEKGSITLFVLISILFFLITAIGIYININNKNISQSSEISKIKSEYKVNKEQMNEIYEETIANQNKKINVSLTKVSDNTNYTSGMWTNDSIKVKIEFPETVPEEERKIYLNGKEMLYTGEIIVEETTSIKVIYEGKVYNYQINIDKESPRVNITSNQSSPTNASSIIYTFTFSENVTGFTQDDITVINGTKGTFNGSGNKYTLEVTNMVTRKSQHFN